MDLLDFYKKKNHLNNGLVGHTSKSNGKKKNFLNSGGSCQFK